MLFFYQNCFNITCANNNHMILYELYDEEHWRRRCTWKLIERRGWHFGFLFWADSKTSSQARQGKPHSQVARKHRFAWKNRQSEGRWEHPADSPLCNGPVGSFESWFGSPILLASRLRFFFNSSESLKGRVSLRQIKFDFEFWSWGHHQMFELIFQSTAVTVE